MFRTLLSAVRSLLALPSAVWEIRSLPGDEETRRRIAENGLLWEKDKATLEVAEWIGTTGLAEAVERSLPYYIRLERGLSLYEAGAVRASDLEYLGAFPEGEAVVHCWKLLDPADNTLSFGVVHIDAHGESLSYGDAEVLPDSAK